MDQDMNIFLQSCSVLELGIFLAEAELQHDEDKQALITLELQERGITFPLSGSNLIALERRRQIEKERRDAAWDSQHGNSELVLAAISYCAHALENNPRALQVSIDTHQLWPWDKVYFKPKTYEQDLIRAGALIAAELDRLLAERNNDEDQSDHF